MVNKLRWAIVCDLERLNCNYKAKEENKKNKLR
jgi:hypothetical protein